MTVLRRETSSSPKGFQLSLGGGGLLAGRHPPSQMSVTEINISEARLSDGVIDDPVRAAGHLLKKAAWRDSSRSRQDGFATVR